jgi:hypothetical protein
MRAPLLCALAAVLASAAWAHEGELHVLQLYGSTAAPSVAPDGNVTLNVSAARFTGGDSVSVSWTIEGGNVSSTSDFVAYFVPAEANVTTAAPVKFKARAAET